MNFNLIATTYRHMENRLHEEMRELLKELGDENAEISHTNISGLLICSTRLDARDVVRRVSSIVKEEPWRIRFMLRLIPIDVVVNTELEEMSREAIRLANAIKEDESYKIIVEKRFTSMHSRDIIEKIAKSIERRVDLEEPDWILLIEIVGKYTGISLLRKDDIFSLEKSRRLVD